MTLLDTVRSHFLHKTMPYNQMHHRMLCFHTHTTDFMQLINKMYFLQQSYNFFNNYSVAKTLDTHTHTHTHLTALRPGLPGWANTRKEKPIWILLQRETVSGSGIRWAICKSEPCSSQIATTVPHHSSFLQAGCPSCRPTNSVKAPKEEKHYFNLTKIAHSGTLLQFVIADDQWMAPVL